MNLTTLSDQSLLNKTLSLAREERAILSQILRHLYEVDRRKLYCEARCGSLYEYCVKILKYSEGQASRRVTAARLLKTSPEIQVPIERGEINLTQIGMINSLVREMELETPGEKKKVIAQLVDEVKGMSTRDTDKVLRDKIGLKPQKVNLKLELTTINKLNEVKALKAHKINDMDELLEMMSAEVMKQWSPAFVVRKTKEALGKTRYIAVKVREEVRKRDKGKCINCGSNYGIQFDHIHPFSMGGRSVTENLQLLCRNCNQRKGERIENFSRPYN